MVDRTFAQTNNVNMQHSQRMDTVLTAASAAAYVADHQEEIGVFGLEAKLAAQEIVGGNLNFAFRVFDDSQQTASSSSATREVFVKQAPDFIKVFGPEAKLHRERLEMEVRENLQLWWPGHGAHQ